MAGNQGIFNRGESISRAQQDYDLFAHIANKPQARQVKNENLAEDKLVRYRRAGDDGMAPSRTESPIRPLLKATLKAVAALPVLVVYVGPRKIAQVVLPVFKKIVQMLPNLFQGMLQKFQNQIYRLKPIVKVIKRLAAAVEKRLKKMAEKISNGFVRAGEFFQKTLLDPLARFGKMVQNALGRLLPERFLPERKLTLQTPYDLVAGGVKWASEWAAGHLGKVAEGVASFLKRGAMELGQSLRPVVKPLTLAASALAIIPSLVASAATSVKAGINRVVQQAERFVVKPCKQAAEKIGKAVAESANQVQIIVQGAATPVINFFASASEFLRSRREKGSYLIGRRFKQMKERFSRFATATASVVSSAAHKVQEAALAWFWNSWIVAVWSGIVKLIGWIAEAVQSGAARMARYAAQAILKLKAKTKYFSKGLGRVLLFFARQIPVALYRIVEWLFGRPGVIILNGVRLALFYAVSGLRQTVQLTREVVVELMNLSF